MPLKWGVGCVESVVAGWSLFFFWGGRGRPVTPYLVHKYSQSLFLADLNNEPEIDTVNIYIEDRGVTRRPPSTFKKKRSLCFPILKLKQEHKRWEDLLPQATTIHTPTIKPLQTTKNKIMPSVSSNISF